MSQGWRGYDAATDGTDPQAFYSALVAEGRFVMVSRVHGSTIRYAGAGLILRQTETVTSFELRGLTKDAALFVCGAASDTTENYMMYATDAPRNPSIPNFSTTATYAVGDQVYYYGTLATCIAAVTTPGAWTGYTNWQPVATGGEPVACAILWGSKTVMSAARANEADGWTVFGATTVYGYEDSSMSWDSSPQYDAVQGIVESLEITADKVFDANGNLATIYTATGRKRYPFCRRQQAQQIAFNATTNNMTYNATYKMNMGESFSGSYVFVSPESQWTAYVNKRQVSATQITPSTFVADM